MATCVVCDDELIMNRDLWMTANKVSNVAA